MKNISRNLGFTVVEIIIAISAIGLLSGTTVFFVARNNAANESRKQLEAANASEANAGDDVDKKAEIDAAEEEPKEEEKPEEKKVAAPKPTPAPKPAPAPEVKKPTPNYDLYKSAAYVFNTCEETETAYVVNPNGAKLSKDYYSTDYVKTIGFGTKVQAKCQDGTGPSSMMVMIGSTTYTANPADFRTTYPYNN